MPSGVRELWHDLYGAGVDVVLNGHEHNYQRYAKQDPEGRATTDGIREFVVGTGGSRIYPLLSAKDPNYEAGQDTSFGVLRMHLEPGHVLLGVRRDRRDRAGRGWPRRLQLIGA